MYTNQLDENNMTLNELNEKQPEHLENIST